MSEERHQAKAIADKWLEEVEVDSRDPDSDECTLARQYLRALEKIERQRRIMDKHKHDLPAVHAYYVNELEDLWPLSPEHEPKTTPIVAPPPQS